MKDRIFAVLALTLVSAFNFQPTTAFAQGTAFTYQGQLNSAGSPANGSYDLVFTLYTTNTTGTAIAGPVTNAATTVTNGLFTTVVNFGTGAFTGTSNWLAIAVSTNGANSFGILTPRQQVTPTPYALVAGSASGVNGLTIQQYSSGAPNLIVGAADNFIAAGTLGATIDGGTNNSIATGASWSGLGGGADNSIAAGSYLSWLGGGYYNSISNNATVDVIVGGQNNSIQNVNNAFIGGGQQNAIQAGASYSFLGGGSGNNVLTGSQYAVLGGGQGNNIQSSASDAFLGGGVANNIYGSDSALGGGEGNTVNGAFNFMGGGADNLISGSGSWYDTLVGGEFNTVSAQFASLGGGYRNSATGFYSTVPGGSNNVASGADSFAAGTGAQAINPGEFVWADDSTGALFSPFVTNSFNVRAKGGVSFVTGGAGLTVDGQPVMTSLPAGAVTNGETFATLGNLTLNTNLLLGGNLRMGGNLTFSQTAAVIYAGNGTMLAFDANNNSSFGLNAGNGGGNNNTALGANALYSNTSGNNNTATGNGALQNNTDSYNTADGSYALQANTAGNKNVAVGYNALNANLTGTNNTASGFDALQNNTAGNNTANGSYALQANTSGNNNVAVGNNALNADTTGVNNTASGFNALQNSTGNYNTAVGGFALQNLQAGDNNIALGYNAGNNLTSGANNIYIGNGAHPNESGVIRIGDANNQTMTYIAGVIQAPSVTTITITGGSDLAEPFSISTKDQSVSEGEVVVIDEANPGQLKLTDQPYDTRVAGVISGANGIHPGIQMHQQGMLEGGKNVALSGRVYVQADTSNGAIKPGDLLTTSSTPGRAMKVSDHARAAGAILGKAMTALSQGQGMVLVLVTLQ